MCAVCSRLACRWWGLRERHPDPGGGAGVGGQADEPPVISVSDDGAVVVPLLGGHRGANRLARQVAGCPGRRGGGDDGRRRDVGRGARRAACRAGAWPTRRRRRRRWPHCWRPGARVSGEAAFGCRLAGRAARGRRGSRSLHEAAPVIPGAETTLVYHPAAGGSGRWLRAGCPEAELRALAERQLDDGRHRAAGGGDRDAGPEGRRAGDARAGPALGGAAARCSRRQSWRRRPPVRRPRRTWSLPRSAAHGVAENAALAWRAGTRWSKRRSARPRLRRRRWRWPRADRGPPDAGPVAGAAFGGGHRAGAGQRGAHPRCRG